jgi:hypothetical protein
VFGKFAKNLHAIKAETFGTLTALKIDKSVQPGKDFRGR